MLLTGVVQNLGTGGTQDGDGRPDDRWPLLAERINSAAERVDFVMLCEVMDWHRYGHKQLARACEDLALDVAPLAPSSSGLGTALLYRREILGRWKRHNPDFADETLHGFAVTTFDVGLPAPLAFVPVHFTPFAAEKATIEVGTVASRGYKYGPYVVLGGDVNYPPASPQSPLPDYSTMRPYNIGARIVRPAPGRTDRDPNRQVTQKLEDHGYVDVAWHLFQKEQDPALLDPTGTDDRIDQAWVSVPVAPAVSGYSSSAAPTAHPTTRASSSPSTPISSIHPTRGNTAERRRYTPPPRPRSGGSAARAEPKGGKIGSSAVVRWSTHSMMPASWEPCDRLRGGVVEFTGSLTDRC